MSYLGGDKFEVEYHQVQYAQVHESRHQGWVHREKLERPVTVDAGLAVIQGTAAADDLQQQLCKVTQGSTEVN